MSARVKRIQGQVAAVSRSLEDGSDCSILLHRVAAARGAMNALMVMLIEDRLQALLEERTESQSFPDAIEEIIEIIHTYLK